MALLIGYLVKEHRLEYLDGKLLLNRPGFQLVAAG